MVLDPVTNRADGEPGLVCAMGGTDGDAVTRLPSGPQVPDRFFAVTDDYLVGRAPPLADGRPICLLHKTGGQSVSVQLPDGASLDWPTSISGNAILITEPTRRTQILKPCQRSCGN